MSPEMCMVVIAYGRNAAEVEAELVRTAEAFSEGTQWVLNSFREKVVVAPMYLEEDLTYCAEGEAVYVRCNDNPDMCGWCG